MNGEFVQQSDKEAITYFDRGCRLDDPNACGTLAVFYRVGREVEVDVPQAASLFKKACDVGQPAACSQYALMKLEGEGVARDARAAEQVLVEHCRDDMPDVCYELGQHYEKGTFDTTPSDSRMAEIYQTACEHGADKIGRASCRERMKSDRADPEQKVT